MRLEPLILVLVVGCARTPPPPELPPAKAQVATPEPEPVPEPPVVLDTRPPRLAPSNEPPCPEARSETFLAEVADGLLVRSACPVQDGTYLRWEATDGRETWTHLPRFSGLDAFIGPQYVWTEGQQDKYRVVEGSYVGDGRLEATFSGPWSAENRDRHSGVALRQGDELHAVNDGGVDVVFANIGERARRLAEAGERDRAVDLLSGLHLAMFSHRPQRALDRTVREVVDDDQVSEMLRKRQTTPIDERTPEQLEADRQRFESALADRRWIEARGVSWVTAVDRRSTLAWWRAMRDEMIARIESGGDLWAVRKFFEPLPSNPDPEVRSVLRPMLEALAAQGSGVISDPQRLLDPLKPDDAVLLAHLSPNPRELAGAMAATKLRSGGVPGRLVAIDDRLCLEYLATTGEFRRWCSNDRSRRLTSLMPDGRVPGCQTVRQGRQVEPMCSREATNRCVPDLIGRITCTDPALAEGPAPHSRFGRLDVAADYACAWGGADRTMQCWGNPAAAGVPKELPDVVQAVVRDTFACALRSTGAITCFGDAPDVPQLKVPDWVLEHEIVLTAKRIEPWPAPTPEDARCTQRSRGAYDEGTLFEIHCVDLVNSSAGDMNEISVRWVSPAGDVVASPTGMAWQTSRFSELDVAADGLRWEEYDELGPDGTPLFYMMRGEGTKVKRAGFAPYVGEGEFGPAEVGRWVPRGATE